MAQPVGAGFDEHGRHRPLRADALSRSSVPSVSSSGYLNGQIVKRACGGVQPGFGNVQVAEGRLQIAAAEQKLDAGQIGACFKKM